MRIAMADAASSTNRFHNLSDRQLADALGRSDAVQKAAEAELKAVKDEFRRRGPSEIAGDDFTVTATDQIAGRADVAALKAHLGDGYRKLGDAISDLRYDAVLCQLASLDIQNEGFSCEASELEHERLGTTARQFVADEQAISTLFYAVRRIDDLTADLERSYHELWEKSRTESQEKAG
jgi:hypothetical protein